MKRTTLLPELVTAPAVFAVGESYQIMAPVKSDLLFWVTVGDRTYCDHSNGILRSATRMHRVTVPMPVLDAAGAYTVHYRKIIERKPYLPESEEEQAATYAFRPLPATGPIRIYHLADTHGNFMLPAAAGSYFGDRLDLLVLTHLDDDHYNGVEQLFARLDVQAVALPAFEDGYGRREEVAALAQAEGAQLYFVEETLEVSLGETVFTLLPPLGKGTTNEEGLFVLCSAGDFDALITGDADSAVEAMLVKYYGIPDVELLFAGHHGSGSSTSAEFLDAVRPEYAVVSSGRNSYGHPHPDTLSRLREAGAEVYRTDLHGKITVTVNKDGSTVTQGGS